MNKRETQVIPAIIPKNFEHLKEQISLVSKIVPRVQVDITDGRFAPSKTWPFENDKGEFEKLSKEEIEFPFWEEVDFELDMMVERPENFVDNWISMGASALILHVGSTDKIEEIARKANARGVEIGIAIKPSVPNEVLNQFLLLEDEDGGKIVDFVQFMGNDKIGFHGVSLDEKVFDKVRDLKKDFPDISVAVDIGVNIDTAPKLRDTGVDKLVAGSAIYSSDGIKESVRELRGE